MKLIILVIALGISWYSQASLIVSPAIFEGCIGDYPQILTVDVYNQYDEAIPLKLEVFNLTQNINGLVELNPVNKPLLIPESDCFKIPAKAKVSLNFQIVDQNKPIYQAVVLKKATDAQKKVVAQGIAILFILALDKDNVRGKTSDLSIVTSGNIQQRFIRFVVENEGLCHFKTEGVFELFDQKGARTEVVLLDKGIVLPGAKREFLGEVLTDIKRCSLVKGQVFFNLAANSQICNIEFQPLDAFERLQTIK